MGLLKPNDFGLFDMLGNAWEWCFDESGKYLSYSERAVADMPQTGTIQANTRRLLRGGAFDEPAGIIRSSFRNHILPTYQMLIYGFRLCRTFDIEH